MDKGITVDEIVVKDTDGGQVIYVPIVVDTEFRAALECVVGEALKDGINAYLTKYIYNNTKELEKRVVETVAIQSRGDIVEAVAAQLRIDDSKFIMALCKELSNTNKENRALKKAMKDLVRIEVKEAISEAKGE